MDIEIRLAKKDDLIEVVELLNSVTLNLNEKNINQWSYPWSDADLINDLKNENIYVVLTDNLIVATFSLKDMGINEVLHVIKPDNLYLYRIAILPEYQGKSIGNKITNYAFKISKNSNKALYLDCWAGNKKLKKFYTGVGFDYCGDYPEDDYMISVFKYL